MTKTLYLVLAFFLNYATTGWAQADASLIAQALTKVKAYTQPLSDDAITQILQSEISYEQNYMSMPKTNITGNGFIVFGVHDVDSYSFLKTTLATSKLPIFWDASINQIEGINQTTTDLPALSLEKDKANTKQYIEQAQKRKQQITKHLQTTSSFILVTNIIHSAEQQDEMGGNTIGLFIDETGKIYQKNTFNIAILAKGHSLQKELAEIRSKDQQLLINTLGLRLYSYNQAFRKGLSPQLRAYINLFDAVILL